MSLLHRRSSLQSKKFVEKKRKKMIGLIFISTLAIISVFVAFIFVLKLPFIQISNIEIRGVDSTFYPKMIELVNARLLGSFAYFIPKSSIVFFNKKDIENALTGSFKNIESLKIKRRGFSTISIDIREYTKSAIVCEGFRQDEENGDSKCFFVDQNGYVFSKVQSASTTSLIPYYIVSDKGDEIIGTNFMNIDRFHSIARFAEGSLKSGIMPLGILIGDADQYEMYVRNIQSKQNSSPTASEITVYFDGKSSLDLTLSNFVAFWNNTFNSQKSKATTTPDFDYINLRYGNTIFYSTK